METEHTSSRHLAKLRELLHELARAPSLQEALERILRAALDEGADSAGVYLLEAHGVGRLAAHAGLDAPFVAKVAHFDPNSRPAAILRAAETRHWGGTEIAALNLPATTQGPIRSLLAEPIILEGQAVGTVVFSSRSSDQIDPASRGFFGVLAALAAASAGRAAARRDLEQREAWFRGMYQNAPLPYQSLDGGGNILEVNDAWQKLFGYERANVIGHSITEYLDASSIPTLEKEFPAFLQRGQVNGAEFRIHTRSGEERRVSVNGRASYDDAGNFLRTHCVLTDVTEARRIDEEMRALLAEKQLILDNAVVGLAVFRNRHFVACNRHFETLLGYEPGELSGRSAQLIHRSEEHFQERGRKIYEALSEGRNFAEEEAFLRKDGSLIWLHVTGRASDPAQPSSEPSVWIFFDLSQRREAEDEIRQLNASLEERVARRTAELEAAIQEMEAYSYSISHDLRAPLRAINGFAQLLLEKEGSRLAPESAAMFERIIRNSNKMGRLIDDILEYSRVGRQTLKCGPVDLDQIAREIAAEQLEAHSRTRAEFGALPVVWGDATMLRQVLENLIGNAFKYSAPRPAPVVRISGARNGIEEIISVMDNGVGFDIAHAGNLFGMFQRLHPEHEFGGTGVGLAIVKRLIEKHGGRIWADAEPGEGARFSFSLPQARGLEQSVTNRA
ncbi:MAG: PAS domain S-box protein [Betaproteobacteria bacterium]|nr:PAS domain S-box protein [Betaproteobacteria bacterium]